MFEKRNTVDGYTNNYSYFNFYNSQYKYNININFVFDLIVMCMITNMHCLLEKENV